MKRQFKDAFYEFLSEPTRDKFRELIKNNYGELDEFDFKRNWIDKGKLAKLILAMGNSGGGVIVFGVEEKGKEGYEPIGLSEFRDPAKINDDIAKYISPNLEYEVFNFDYDQSEYPAMEGKKFQTVQVCDKPDKLPFISLSETDGLEKDAIYIRRGTKSEKAKSEDIERLIHRRMKKIFKEGSNLKLDEHLSQLKKLYNELPKKIKILVRKGEPSSFERLSQQIRRSIGVTDDEYEEKENPNCPEESYEAFILRMVENKKLKIEKVMDLK